MLDKGHPVVKPDAPFFYGNIEKILLHHNFEVSPCMNTAAAPADNTVEHITDSGNDSGLCL